MNLTRHIFVGLVVLSFYGTYYEALAQGICVASPLKVTTFQGQVVWSNDTPIESAKVTVTRDLLGRKILAQRSTDSDGLFEFPRISRGLYFVTVTHPEMRSFTTKVKVTKEPKKRLGLKITLEFPLTDKCSTATTFNYGP